MTVGPYATPHGSTACGALSSSQRGVKHPRGGGESKPLGPKKNTLGSKKNQLGLKKHFRTKKKQIRIKKKPFRIKKNRGRFRIKKNICFFFGSGLRLKKKRFRTKKKAAPAPAIYDSFLFILHITCTRHVCRGGLDVCWGSRSGTPPPP